MLESHRKFEEDISFIQSLSFNEFNEIIKRFRISTSSNLFVNLGMKNNSGKFYALGLLLSDQNIFTCQITYLKTGKEDGEKESLAFKGSLLKQLFCVYRYLAGKNSQSTKSKRASTDDYPREALWFAVVFAFLVHDYSTMWNLYIKCFPDRIEFSPDIVVENMKEPAESRIQYMKRKQSRLIRIFNFLKLVDIENLGLNRIYLAYNSHNEQPEIVLSSECFKIVLPNRNVSA